MILGCGFAKSVGETVSRDHFISRGWRACIGRRAGEVQRVVPCLSALVRLQCESILHVCVISVLHFETCFSVHF